MSTKDFVRKAVQDKLSNAQDNLHRARAASRRCDSTQAWGESGQTLNDIITGYESDLAEAEAALKSIT